MTILAREYSQTECVALMKTIKFNTPSICHRMAQEYKLKRLKGVRNF